MIYTTAYIQYAHISHRLSGDRIRLPVFRMRAQKQWAPSESRAGGRPAGRASRPADLRRRQERLGKGQMGSASLQIPCFFTEGLLGVFPLTYFYHPKSARAHLFPQLVKNHNFCSGPISVDPICPQPRNSQSNENVESTLRRAAEREREREREFRKRARTTKHGRAVRRGSPQANEWEVTNLCLAKTIVYQKCLLCPLSN